METGVQFPVAQFFAFFAGRDSDPATDVGGSNAPVFIPKLAAVAEIRRFPCAVRRAFSAKHFTYNVDVVCRLLKDVFGFGVGERRRRGAVDPTMGDYGKSSRYARGRSHARITRAFFPPRHSFAVGVSAPPPLPSRRRDDEDSLSLIHI